MVYINDSDKAISLNQLTKERVVEAWRGLCFKAKVKTDMQQSTGNERVQQLMDYKRQLLLVRCFLAWRT